MKQKKESTKYKVVWTCDFCKKEFDTKKESDQHELTCVKNPLVSKNNKKFLKLSKISRIIWVICIFMVILIGFLDPRSFSSFRPYVFVISSIAELSRP